MRTLIEQLHAQMRHPYSIAFRLVKLGYFTDIQPAAELVIRVLGSVPFRRN